MENRLAGMLICVVLVAGSLVWFTEAGRAAEGDISGTITSSTRPEEGVWVIAETTDLPTKFIKSVVTGDGGRYLIPDLPEASYKVWVRGYGLLDSAGVTAEPGATVDIQATVASTPAEAARVYPANYWYSLIEPPAPSEFPGTGPDGNGIATNLQHQGQWVDIQKQGCMLCHQLGNRIIRQIDNLEQFDSTLAAWDHRVKMGQRGSQMTNVMSRFGRERGLQMFADWSDRVAAGAVPPAPPRPRGVERNVVISMWEWGTEVDYIHDEIATDKRNPRVNANGPIYGVNISNDELAMLDPVTHLATNLKIPLRVDPETVPGMIARSMPEPSRFWGEELVWNDPANPHNPMMDAKGRVWMTSAIRNRANPDWCKDGSDNPYAQYFPLENGFRSAVFYEPETQKFVMIDTCYGTHHLQFAEDEQDTLYFSGGGQVIGWIDTKLYDETGDEQMSQGWCPTVLDTNGDGTISTPWNEPDRRGEYEDFDTNLDTRVVVGSYGIIGDPTDDKAVWISSTRFPGRLARLHVGDNPPETCVTEMYEVPSVLDPNVPRAQTGFGPRGIDIDRNGIVWTALSGSSHFASFDRTKCALTNGPSVADGRHCVDGWTLYSDPGASGSGHRPAVARRLPLLQLGRSVEHARVGCERPDRERVELGLAAGSESGYG